VRRLIREERVVCEKTEDGRLVSGRAGTRLRDKKSLCVQEFLERLHVCAAIPELLILRE